MLIGVFGPDGIGKSATVRGTIDLLGDSFEVERRFGRPYRVYRGKQGQFTSTPHATVPRGYVTALMKLAVWMVDYTYGWFTQVRPATVRGTVVAFDRYYDDLWADPIKHRLHRIAGVARALRRLVPQPSLIVVLDAPGEVVAARKGELPVSDANELRPRYRRVAGVSHGTLVDACLPPDEVASRVATAVLCAFADRTERRLGLRRSAWSRVRLRQEATSHVKARRTALGEAGTLNLSAATQSDRRDS